MCPVREVQAPRDHREGEDGARPTPVGARGRLGLEAVAHVLRQRGTAGRCPGKESDRRRRYGQRGRGLARDMPSAAGREP